MAPPLPPFPPVARESSPLLAKYSFLLHPCVFLFISEGIIISALGCRSFALPCDRKLEGERLSFRSVLILLFSFMSEGWSSYVVSHAVRGQGIFHPEESFLHHLFLSSIKY